MENRGCDVAKKYGVSFVVAVVPPFLIPYFPPTVFFLYSDNQLSLVMTLTPSFSNLSLLWTGDTFDQKSLNFVKSNLIEILNTNYDA